MPAGNWSICTIPSLLLWTASYKLLSGIEMVVCNPLRDLIWVAFFTCVVATPGWSQTGPPALICKGPAELESVIHSHPSAGAYDALGAYFGRQQKLSCAISAFESAIRLEPNSWEAHFNLALALLQLHQTERAVRELRMAIKTKPDDPLGTYCIGNGAQ